MRIHFFTAPFHVDRPPSPLFLLPAGCLFPNRICFCEMHA